MRFVFGEGWKHIFDETDGDDGNGATGGASGGDGDAGGEAGGDATDDAAGAGDGAAAGTGDDPDGKGADAEPKTMEEAIAHIGRKPDEGDDATKAAPKKEAVEGKPVVPGKETDAHWANGKPKKDDKGNEVDAEGKVTKAAPAQKVKTAAELELKPEEKKALGAKANQRFGEMVTTLKSREAEVSRLTEENTKLGTARDSIVSVLNETKTTSAQLSGYLEFNRLIQSTIPKDLEAALEMVEAQRGELYKALGREPGDGGIDLLKEFPDLSEKVKDATLTREDALELANGRREKAAAEARAAAGRERQEGVQQAQQARENALKGITSWTKEMAAKDIDYQGKEEKLLEQVDEVIKTYPPSDWLKTLKLMYSGIVIQKAPTTVRKGEQPLRPSGAKAGAKAPQNMFEAMWGKEHQA